LSSLTRIVPGSLLLLALLGGCDRQSGKDAQPAASTASTESAAQPAAAFDRSHKGSPLPELTFTDTAGKSVRLAALTGKPLLVNLWATWCAPCVAELPTLDALAGTKGAALQVLAVSQDMGESTSDGKGDGRDDGTAARVKAFWDRKGLTHIKPLLDPQGKASSQYQATTLPTTIYYDAQGHEVWRLVGGHDWASQETRTLLAEGAR